MGDPKLAPAVRAAPGLTLHSEAGLLDRACSGVVDHVYFVAVRSPATMGKLRSQANISDSK